LHIGDLMLDDDTIDRMLAAVERRAPTGTMLARVPKGPIARGAGTVGLGVYAPALHELGKDQALYTYLTEVERRRKDRRRRLQAEKLSAPRTHAVEAAEHRDAREQVLERRRDEVARLRAANAQRHVEGVVAEKERREAEAQMLAFLQDERRKAKEMARAAKQEFLEEKVHERTERLQREQQDALRVAQDMAQQQALSHDRIGRLHTQSQQAHQEARHAVQTLRDQQKRAKAREAERLAALFKAREEETLKEREENREAIAAERKRHRAAMAAADELRYHRLTDCRSFANTPIPNTDTIRALRESRVAQVRESIQRSRSAMGQPEDASI
jgi:hypothetical protein